MTDAELALSIVLGLVEGVLLLAILSLGFLVIATVKEETEKETYNDRPTDERGAGAGAA